MKTVGKFKWGWGIVLFAFAASPGWGADLSDTVLRMKAVHPVVGPDLMPGEVRFHDGRIAAVGTSVDHAGAAVIDLTNLHLYPGLVALDSAMGLTEISGVRATLDLTEVGQFTPEVESWLAVNPDSELIPVARANGIVCFEAAPQGGTVSGVSGLIAVEGWTIEQRVLKKAAAVHVFWPSMELTPPPPRSGNPSRLPAKSLEEQDRERRAKLRELDEFFAEARAYAQAKAAAADHHASLPPLVPAWEALIPAVRGDLPVTVHANELRQIVAAVNWAKERQLKLILAGARDAGLAADLLGTNRIPVIFEHVFSQPSRDYLGYDFLFRTPELLRQAGSTCALSIGGDAFNAAQTRNLPYLAAHCAAFGMPHDEALKLITLHPAQIAGIADRLGSIEVGRDASVFATDGDILDARVQVKRMWVQGRESVLEDRQTRLYQRYRNRPKPTETK